MRRQAALCLLVLAIATAVPAAAAGDAERGAVAFRACVACHSLEQGVHLTGPREISSFVRARCDE
jgi:cytochrome c